MSHFHKTISHIFVLILLALVCAIPVAGQTKTKRNEAPPTGLLREPPTPDSCVKQTGKAINMLVIGDSIMWGQGLNEKNKISYRVQDWLCTQAKRPVNLWREAHSGAVIEIDPAELTSLAEDSLETDEAPAKTSAANHSTNTAAAVIPELDGEINVSEPTIKAQLDHALSKMDGSRVDFVLMDGCINDFDVIANVLNPVMTRGQVEARAKKVCYERMKPLLDDAAKRLPNARFIVTGYYPVMTKDSSRNILLRYILGSFLRKEKQKWLFPNAKKRLFQNLIQVSKEFGEFSNRYLRQSVEEADGARGRIVFAPVYNPPDSRFGSDGSGFAAPKPTALLWTTRFNSTGLGSFKKFFYVIFRLHIHAFRPNDEVYFQRRDACDGAKKGIICRVAAFGHPNSKGVNEYVERVTTELRRFMANSDWLED